LVKYSHDEILNAVDEALRRALEDSINTLKAKANIPQQALMTISNLIAQKRYANIRGINKPPPEAENESRKRPDIWFFGGALVVEIKVDESEFDTARRQLITYVNEFFRESSLVAIVTNGFIWEFYEVRRDGGITLRLINKFYADKTLYEGGAILEAIVSKDELYNSLRHIFEYILTQTQVYRYHPDPTTVYRVFYPILGYVDDIIELIRKYDVENKALFQSYKEIMVRLYAGLSDEDILRLFATHTLLQMIVNSILTRVLNRDFGDPIKTCSGELLEPYEVALPHLLWWRGVLVNGNSVDKARLEGICGDIIAYTYLFDWSYETGLDIFSHLYEDFIDRTLRYRVGEYYTPWWLIELILERLVAMGASIKDDIVLDPSCGSGRFLVSTFYRKVKEGEDPEKAYYSIVGIDINPLATSIARAEMIIAYRYARKEDPPGTPLVFWGDSIGPAVGFEIELIKELESVNIKFYTISSQVLFTEKLRSKSDALRVMTLTEALLSRILRVLAEGGSIHLVRKTVNQVCGYVSKDVQDISRKISCNIVERFINDEEAMRKLQELIKIYGNHVWAVPMVSELYILALQSIKAFKPDIVVTNPPWLELNELPKSKWGMKIREYVRNNYVDKRNLPSQVVQKGDIAMVFLDIALRFIDKNGYIGIVLPAEQTYSGAVSSHGVGKLLTYAVFEKWGCMGEILYVGDVFGHGIPTSIAIVKKGEEGEQS